MARETEKPHPGGSARRSRDGHVGGAGGHQRCAHRPFSRRRRPARKAADDPVAGP